MKISEAIVLLAAVQDKHGDVQVYFDCPYCDKVFAPTEVKALGAHVTGVDERRVALAKKEKPR